MGMVRKWTGQKGAIEREKRYMNEQADAARDSERRQTNAMNESIRQAAVSQRLAQEREAAQASASSELSKPLEEADVSIGGGSDSSIDVLTKSRRKKFGQDYSSGVNI
jgi:hypothetical protein